MWIVLIDINNSEIELMKGRFMLLVPSWGEGRRCGFVVWYQIVTFSRRRSGKSIALANLPLGMQRGTSG